MTPAQRNTLANLIDWHDSPPVEQSEHPTGTYIVKFRKGSITFQYNIYAHGHFDTRNLVPPEQGGIDPLLDEWIDTYNQRNKE